MDNEVGRAGFHVTHEFRASKRGAILDEMMRERIPGASERWAQRNPNIVLEDEDSNIAIVNDGQGWFSLCKDPKKVLAYGEERLAKLSHRVKEPKLDPKKGKEWGGTWTSSMFVIQLPKTLCEEVEDFYPVFDKDGNETGQRRSRWVARDREEALRYFKDALRYLAEEVIPGGQEAILGADIQFSESRPHMQILADPFAPDPKHPGQLRSDFSRAYGQHRDVRDEKGKQIGGPAKIGRYQEGFRKRMVELGWPVELDVDPLRHDKTATKAVYGAMKDKERALAEQEQKLVADIAAANSVIESEIKARVDELADERKNLDTERAAVELERQQLQKDKQKALEEAREDGYAQGLDEGRAEVGHLQETARKRAVDAGNALVEATRHLTNVQGSRPLSGEQARSFFLDGVQMLANTLAKGVNDPAMKALIEAKREAWSRFAGSPDFVEFAKSNKERIATNQAQTISSYQRNQRRVEGHVSEVTESLDTPQSEGDNGMELM